METKKLNTIISFLLVSGLFVFLIFLSGCTDIFTGKGTESVISGSNAVVLNKVYYDKDVKANTNIEIKVELENRGEEARNIKVQLIGLSNKWNPYPVPPQTLPSLQNKEKKNVTFTLITPLVDANTTYSFGVYVEYDYSSSYSAMLKLEKDKQTNTVKATVTNEKMVYEAPLTIKSSNIQVDENNRKIIASFIIRNSGNGEVKNNGKVVITSSGISCETQTTLEEAEKEIKCETNIPNFENIYNLEFSIKLSYTYSYKTSEDAYKIEVYKV
ncbi:MAG: hypothetical protein QXP34_02905 [Candidatus Aenigmatarchaeota archaeon]